VRFGSHGAGSTKYNVQSTSRPACVNRGKVAAGKKCLGDKEVKPI
jgi:hypothetical protein